MEKFYNWVEGRPNFEEAAQNAFYSDKGTVEPPFSGHLCQEDTFLLRTPMFSPKLVISIQCDLHNQDTS
jgi:hypothetical protein